MLKNRDTRIDRLASIEVLSGLSKRELREVATLTTEVPLAAGHVLCRQGDVAQEAFLLVSGTVSVTRDGVPMGVVDRGAFLGEAALLERQPRRATLTALTDVTILALSSREFSYLTTRFPSVAAAMRSLVYTRTDEHVLVPTVVARPTRRGLGAAVG